MPNKRIVSEGGSACCELLTHFALSIHQQSFVEHLPCSFLIQSPTLNSGWPSEVRYRYALVGTPQHNSNTPHHKVLLHCILHSAGAQRLFSPKSVLLPDTLLYLQSSVQAVPFSPHTLILSPYEFWFANPVCNLILAAFEAICPSGSISIHSYIVVKSSGSHELVPAWISQPYHAKLHYKKHLYLVSLLGTGTCYPSTKLAWSRNCCKASGLYRLSSCTKWIRESFSLRPSTPFFLGWLEHDHFYTLYIYITSRRLNSLFDRINHVAKSQEDRAPSDLNRLESTCPRVRNFAGNRDPASISTGQLLVMVYPSSHKTFMI